VLYLIYDDDVILLQEAPYLGLSHSRLYNILKGREAVSRTFVLEHKWGEGLAERHPHRWKLYGDLFNRAVQRLPLKGGTKVLEPEDKSGIGHVIWQIFGGNQEPIHVRREATRLKIHPSRLSAIMHGVPGILSQQYLNDNNWRAIFAEHHPERWAREKNALEALAAQLPKYSHSKTFEPEDKSGPGALFWQMLGGMSAKITPWAELLGINQKNLSRTIHNDEWHYSIRTMLNKRWPHVIASREPAYWLKYGERWGALVNRCPGNRLRGEPDLQVLWERALEEATGIANGLILAERQRALSGQKFRPGNVIPKKNLMLKVRSPFGNELWYILGCKKADFAAEAPRLGLGENRVNLCHIIYGRRQPSTRFLLDKQWPLVLADHHPVTFLQRWRKFMELGLRPYGKGKILKPETILQWNIMMNKAVENARGRLESEKKEAAAKDKPQRPAFPGPAHFNGTGTNGLSR